MEWCFCLLKGCRNLNHSRNFSCSQSGGGLSALYLDILMTPHRYVGNNKRLMLLLPCLHVMMQTLAGFLKGTHLLLLPLAVANNTRRSDQTKSSHKNKKVHLPHATTVWRRSPFTGSACTLSRETRIPNNKMI